MPLILIGVVIFSVLVGAEIGKSNSAPSVNIIDISKGEQK